MNRTAQEAVASGITWLGGSQEPTGEFASYASSLQGEPAWAPDRLNFVTALTSLALEQVQDPEVQRMRARVADYLIGEREPGALWRYWSSEAELHGYTPRDVDDTACCSLASGAAQNQANVALLLANRDPDGRFYTWFLPRPRGRNLKLWWTIRDERTTPVLERRDELWANSEASPDDVDVTVNANVVRYLGPDVAPVEAVEWIASVVEAGREIEEDHWYRSRTSLYRSVAISAVAGIERFALLRDLIVSRLVSDPGPDALRNDLERADALQVLRLLDAPATDIERHAADLLSRQSHEGHWARSICYYGGPQESFGWASECLSTATAVGALHGL